MPEISVRSAKIEVRTVSLTRSLLKQFQQMRRFPEGWIKEDGSLAHPENVLGWVHGSVIDPDGCPKYLILQHNGDWYIYGTYDTRAILKGVKQLYI
jgi:hypothetical protein